MPAPPARSLTQRTRDTLHRLENDVDLWVTTADPASGSPYMIPLSFHWDGQVILLATAASSPTGRNLMASRQVRLGIGETRDVVLVEGEVARSFPAAEIADALGDTFAVALASTRVSPARPSCSSRSVHCASRRGARRTSWPAERSCATARGSMRP